MQVRQMCSVNKSILIQFREIRKGKLVLRLKVFKNKKNTFIIFLIIFDIYFDFTSAKTSNVCFHFYKSKFLEPANKIYLHCFSLSASSRDCLSYNQQWLAVSLSEDVIWRGINALFLKITTVNALISVYKTWKLLFYFWFIDITKSIKSCSYIFTMKLF